MKRKVEVIVKERNGMIMLRFVKPCDLPITFKDMQCIGVACDVKIGDEDGCLYAIAIGRKEGVREWLRGFGGCDVLRFDLVR